MKLIKLNKETTGLDVNYVINPNFIAVMRVQPMYEPDPYDNLPFSEKLKDYSIYIYFHNEPSQAFTLDGYETQEEAERVMNSLTDLINAD